MKKGSLKSRWLLMAKAHAEYAADIAAAGATEKELAYTHNAELICWRHAHGLSSADIPSGTDAKNQRLVRRFPGIPGPGVR